MHAFIALLTASQVSGCLPLPCHLQQLCPLVAVLPGGRSNPGTDWFAALLGLSWGTQV